jgi:hypothetical protein
MPYTPELSVKSCCTLRRIAWAAGLPMTKAINQVFELIPEVIDKKSVCAACKDVSKCAVCGFSQIKKQDIIPVTIKDKKIRINDPAEET